MIEILKKLGIALILSTVTVVLSFNIPKFFMPDIFDSFENAFIERLHAWNMVGTEENVRDEIVIVDLDYVTYASAERKLTHKDIAEGIKKISDYGASSILLDIGMDFKEDSTSDSAAAAIFSQIPNFGMTGLLVNDRQGFKARSELDSAVRKAISRFSINVNYPEDMIKDTADYVRAPLPSFLEHSSFFGFVSVYYDKNQRLSHVPLLYNHLGGVYPSAELATIAHSYDLDLNSLIVNNGTFKLEGINLNYDKLGHRFHVEGPDMTFTTYSFRKLDVLPAECFARKIVLVGRSLGGSDFHSVKSGHRLFGTEIIANSIYSTMTGKRFRSHPFMNMVVICFVISLAISLLSISRFYFLSPFFAVIMLSILMLYIMITFGTTSIEISGIKPVLSIIISLVLSYLYKIIILKRTVKMYNKSM